MNAKRFRKNRYGAARMTGRHRVSGADDIPTKPFPPIVTDDLVFEGAAVPPYIGTHIAMYCPVCGHVAWTYRNTDEGWRLLLERITEHRQVHP